MSNTNLNLARKWRSRAFDQIIGQDLPIRMLKNSLYLESFFPVYLFSGQRGCGKTTMARVFAASINCELLSEFQKNPKTHAVPCLNCFSCQSMLSGKHPDFIEIDAASHTGVDNVRQIIDAASLLPVMGRKKIYLIDEAHMLSKAAFNAFLKILEEPPMSVHFILATTDPQKILETVKSRCFQLFFTAVEAPKLFDHLVNICQQEEIKYEPAGLQLVIKATEGSVRDALNLLEQVRFSTSNVTKEAVLNVLGHIDDERLFSLFERAMTKGPSSVLRFIADNKLELYSADFIWRQLVELARAALWAKHGVESPQFNELNSRLKTLVRSCSWEQLNEALDIFYSNESIFMRTTAQHAFLEMILLKLAQKNRTDDSSGTSSVPQSAAASEYVEDEVIVSDEEDDGDSDEDEEDEEEEDVEGSAIKCWTQFVNSISSLQEPLLNSVFSQGKFIQCDMATKTLDVEFSKELTFFKDWLNETNKLWLPLLNKAFGCEMILNSLFNGAPAAKVEVAVIKQTPALSKPSMPASQASSYKQSKTAQNQNSNQDSYKKNFQKPFTPQKKFAPRIQNNNPVVDISDKALWKKANMLVNYFPGTVREMRENLHEQKS